MGSIKDKLFPKKKPEKENLSTEAQLKRVIQKLGMQIKDYDKKSKLAHERAKQFLKAGNRVAAKNMLAQAKNYQQKVSQYSAIIMKARRRLDALTQAETLKEVGGAMEGTAVQLKQAAQEINLQHAMEVDAEAESAIDEIEEAAELYAGDVELDYGLDMDEELSQLETEVMLEEAGKLPETPAGAETTGISDVDLLLEDIGEEVPDDTNKLKDEISKLRKELDL